MLTDAFYRVLANALRAHGAAEFAIAVGSGRPDWDRQRPAPARGATTLVSEIARRNVALEDVTFLDASGRATSSATTRLQFATVFDAGEATGTLRECGLFLGGGQPGDTGGTLLSYFMHARIAKSDDMVLSRAIRLDLSPRAAGTQPATRFLGNVNQRELHDLDNITPNCRIDQISTDRRFMFATIEDAVAAGYDFCAYCFGRELSRR